MIEAWRNYERNGRGLEEENRAEEVGMTEAGRDLGRER
jgi:hypothetical protein